MNKLSVNRSLFFVLLACAICLSSFQKASQRNPVENIFSVFKLGTPGKTVNRFLLPGATTLSNGATARKFDRNFAALGDAVVTKGVVVFHNDTIRALLLQLDSTNGKKLWDGMADLYGATDSLTGSGDVVDMNEWIINNTSFCMYEVHGVHHALYRDIEYFKRKRLNNYILSELDFL